MGLSNEAFAKRLDIGLRTVADWHQKPTTRPQSGMQETLDTALEQASPAIKTRFAALTSDSSQLDNTATEAEHRLRADPNISAALDWLDQHASWEPGTARRGVAARLSQVDVQQLLDREARRGQVDQRRIAEALRMYYRDRPNEHGQYSVAGSLTSILTHPDWLDLECSLMPPNDRLTVTNTTADLDVSLDDAMAGRAAQRLAETLALNIRLVDSPLFRIVDIQPSRGTIRGTAEVTRFVRYALTMDLLEGELVDAVAAGAPVSPGSLPLRNAYLPDVASALDLPSRLCSGGTLALCAIARPADPFRGPADYVLLIQERSCQVVNAACRLAVIPKGFHQPITDYRTDVHLAATLRREMEEELFGRDDIDSTAGQQRRADPMHASRMSEPMRWLMDHPDQLRMECTGFGLNLVSGNFEFPGLIVVDDEDFYTRFGGQIEANWETSSLRQYSSRDRDLLGELAADESWSNEGLFALLQGLRRLSEVGGDRVNAPTIEWEIN
jgi:hypothetical protein